jgi:hypothetical protein
MSALISFGESLIFMSATGQNGRARLFARCLYCSQGTRRQQVGAGRLGAAIDKNMKEMWNVV